MDGVIYYTFHALHANIIIIGGSSGPDCNKLGFDISTSGVDVTSSIGVVSPDTKQRENGVSQAQCC